MASSSPSKATPNVQHNFDGDARVLNSTFEKRTEVRKALTALAQDLQRIQGCSTQIKAEIKLQVGGDRPQEHTYNVTISDPSFNAVEFARVVPQTTSTQEKLASAGIASSPQNAGRTNGQQATPDRTTSRADMDDDIMEIRPFKRQKTATEKPASTAHQHGPSAPMQLPGPVDSEEALSYLKNWHEEWLRQGGWLYDTLNKTSNVCMGLRGSLEKKLESVQDIIGQSINASSASSINELGSITKLIHWLEHCRKTSADKLQAREEKWRSSSATFHDAARREREAAESRIERKLDEQNELLSKLARASNIAIPRANQQSGGSDERSREASLGAQLRSELNMEAERNGGSGNHPFSIDD